MQITRKLIITQTFWSAVAQIGVMGINLLVLPLFIKNLGAELYGIWILSGVVMGYLNVFDFGFTQGLQKYVAEARVKGDHKELSEVVVTGTGLLLIIGLLLGVLFWAGAQPIVEFFNIQPEHQLIATRLLRISAVFCVVMWPLRIVDVVLNATMHIKELSFLNAFKTGVQSLVMLGMVLVATDIVLIKWVTAGLIALFSVCGLVLLKKYVPEIKWSPFCFKLGQLKRMHKFSLGMFYLSLLGVLSVKVDNLLIGRLLNVEMVAVYAIIAKPYEIIGRLCGMFMQTLTPAIFNLLPKASLDEKEKAVCSAVKYRTFFLIPITVVAIWAIPPFFNLWVGESYSGYAVWAQIFAAVHLFMGIASLGVIGRADGQMKTVNGMLTVKVFLNVVLSIILTVKMGVGGVVLGTFLSNVLFGELLFGLVICRKMGICYSQVVSNFINQAGLGVVFLIFFLVYKVHVQSWGLLLLYSGLMYFVLLTVFAVIFLRDEALWFVRRCKLLAAG